MIENVMRQMGGIGNYGLISICLFFTFFVGVLLWVVRLKKGYLQAMGQLPLQDGSTNAADTNSAPENSHEHTR